MSKTLANININTIESDIQDSLRSADIIDHLICEPDSFSCGIPEVLGSVIVFAPEKTEEEPSRLQVVDGPWLNVVYFNYFKISNANFLSEGRKET